MAIVQISRIQHRRGRKLAGSGMPQLASGEIGWAIDTQELFIGNGAVSEGAPTVGNTKVLTEHDDIFALADQYRYKPENNLWGSQIPNSRSLQSKLDDVVSVFDFGATGDGTDQTAAIQRAVNSLYKNSEIANRVVLWFPAGEYTVSSTIEIPPYATLRGAGKGKTIITGDNCNIFTTIHYNPSNPTETISTLNQARYIEISDMTLVVPSKDYEALSLRSCVFSVFKNIRFEGVWPINGIEGTYFTHKAINLYAESTAVTSQSNIFENIEIDSFHYGVYSDYDIKNNLFTKCNFYQMSQAIVFGKETIIGSVGMLTGPLFNTVENSIFDRIDKEAFLVQNGEYNASRGNKYFNVGNNNGNAPIVYSAVINFVTNTNVSDLDYFDRTAQLTPNAESDEFYNIEYVPEVAGRKRYKNTYVNEISIGELIEDPFTLEVPSVLKFPAVESGAIYVDYVYTETDNDIVREGTMTISCKLSPTGSSLIFSDEYNFIGDTGLASALVFSANLSDLGGTVSEPETVIIKATNSLGVLNDSFSYTIRVKS